MGTCQRPSNIKHPQHNYNYIEKFGYHSYLKLLNFASVSFNYNICLTLSPAEPGYALPLQTVDLDELASEEAN